VPFALAQLVALDVTDQPLHPGVEPVDPVGDDSELRPGVGLERVEALVHLVEPLVHLLEPLVHLLEPLVNLLEPLLDQAGQLVDGAGDLADVPGEPAVYPLAGLDLLDHGVERRADLRFGLLGHTDPFDGVHDETGWVPDNPDRRSSAAESDPACPARLPLPVRSGRW
jgi:hypothetical protein